MGVEEYTSYGQATVVKECLTGWHI